MKNLLIIIVSIACLYCIAELVNSMNAYGMFMSAMFVVCVTITAYVTHDRDAYRKHFRDGKKIIQSYRDEYERE